MKFRAGAFTIVGAIAVLLGGVLLLQPMLLQPNDRLRRLPRGVGPFPWDKRLVSKVQRDLPRAKDEQAIIKGIYYLWRVRGADSTIMPFLDEFIRSQPPWISDVYTLLKEEEKIAGPSTTSK